MSDLYIGERPLSDYRVAGHRLVMGRVPAPPEVRRRAMAGMWDDVDRHGRMTRFQWIKREARHYGRDYLPAALGYSPSSTPAFDLWRIRNMPAMDAIVALRRRIRRETPCPMSPAQMTLARAAYVAERLAVLRNRAQVRALAAE